MIVTDVPNLLLALIPVLVSGFLYYQFVFWSFGELVERGKSFVREYIQFEGLGFILEKILMVLVVIFICLVINWTFTLVVGILAGPFNDFLSERVEKQLGGGVVPSLGKGFIKITRNLFAILVNEIKKVMFVIVMSFFGFFLGLIPVLTPVSLVIAAILISASFLDYSWSRHHFSLSRCLGDLKKDFFSQVIIGGSYTLLMAIPFINIILNPIAVVQFTILFYNRNQDLCVAKEGTNPTLGPENEKKDTHQVTT